MRRRLMLFALLGGLALSSWPRSASAQVSIWLQKGTSGAGAAAVFAYNEDQTTYGGNFGYSIRGFLELAITVAFLTFPNDGELPDDLVGLALAPRIELHPLKQGPGMPVSVGLGGGITGFGYSSEELDRMNVELRGNNINADASIYRFFKLASRFGVTPSLGAGYVRSSVTLTQGSSETTDTDDSFSFIGAAYFAFLDPGGRIWGVAPLVSISEVVTVGMQAGIVWTL